MEKSSKLEDIYYVFVSAYLVFTLVVTFFSLHLFGDFYSFTNKSGSMNPGINTGSITIVRKMNTYGVGDAISYYAKINDKEDIITHRIIRIGGNVYVTKGDANPGIDTPIVLPRLIIGKVVLIIPYLGYIVSFAKSAFGWWLTIVIPATFIIFMELYRIVKVLSNK